MKKYRIFLSIFIIYILINMALFPSLYISRTLDGISAWAFNVLPSVLPFIFFIKLLTSLNILEKFTKIFSVPCQKLFKTPASSSSTQQASTTKSLINSSPPSPVPIRPQRQATNEKPTIAFPTPSTRSSATRTCSRS